MTTTGSWRRVPLALVALLVSVVAGVPYAAAPAEAVPGLITETGSSRVLSGSVATTMAIAPCPSGTKVYGGGAEVVTDSGTPGNVAITAIRPNSSLTNFSATADAVRPFVGTWHLVVTAYCAPPLPGLEFVFAYTDVSLTTTQLARATCPSGKRLLGGGGAAAMGHGKVLVNSWSPDQFSYGVRATASVPLTEGYQMFAYAICAPTSGTVLPIFDASGLQSASPATKTTYSCPSGQVHSAGGGTAGEDGNIVIDKVVASADGTRSTIRAYERVPTANLWQLIAQATCA